MNNTSKAFKNSLLLVFDTLLFVGCHSRADIARLALAHDIKEVASGLRKQISEGTASYSGATAAMEKAAEVARSSAFPSDRAAMIADAFILYATNVKIGEAMGKTAEAVSAEMADHLEHTANELQQ